MKTIFTFLITIITINALSQITYYSDRDSLIETFSGTLVLEDFEGGPTGGGNTGCDGDFSAAGNSCYPPGEIQLGFVLTSSDNSPDTPMVFTPAGLVENLTHVVGTNQLPSYTILNFTEDNINTVAIDLYGLPFASTMDVRIYSEDGLEDTLTITEDLPGPYFFGFIATIPIVSIEFQVYGSSVEMIGMLAFGTNNPASIDDLDTYNFTYFPNPVSNSLTLQANTNISSVSITNILGQKIMQSDPFSNRTTLNLSNLKKGIYYVKAKINNKIGVYKFIKE